MTVPVAAVRRATGDDREELLALQRTARAAVHAARGGAAHLSLDRPEAAARRELVAALDGTDEAFAAFVGTLDGVPVGYALVVQVVDESGSAVARIAELFVVPDAREVGVGEALMTGVSSWARQKGCGALDAIALPGDRGTKNFFESHLLVARAIAVSRRLDDGDVDEAVEPGGSGTS